MCRRHDKTEHWAFWSHPGSGASPVRLAGRGGSVPGCQSLESESCFAAGLSLHLATAFQPKERWALPTHFLRAKHEPSRKWG